MLDAWGGAEENPDELGWFDRTAMSVLRRFRLYRHPLRVLLPLLMGALTLPLAVPALVDAFGLGFPTLVAAIASVVLLVPGIFFALIVNRGLTVSTDFAKAFAKGDIDEVTRLKRLMDGTGPPRSPHERANRDVGDAELLLHLERWAEARDSFARIDREALPLHARPCVLSEQGYATAHAGQPELGVELLEKAMEEAEAQPDCPAAKRWFVRVRLGITLSLAGRHDDAIAALDAVLPDDGGDLREWTAGQFFLGRSLRASGSFDDAMMSFEAAAHHGEGPFAPRAKAALDLASGSPLRDGGHVREPLVDEDAEPDRAEPSTPKRARRP